MSYDPPTKERQIFGISATTASAALLGVIGGALGTMFTQWWTAKEPHLIQTVSEIVPFKGDKGEVGILNIRLVNDGNKEAEDLEGRIQILGAAIEEVKIVPEIVHAEKVVKNDALEVKVKLLNPNQSVQISAVVRKSSEMPSKPVVDFRGKGITAEDAPIDKTDYFKSTTIIFSLLSIIGAIIFSKISDRSRSEDAVKFGKTIDNVSALIGSLQDEIKTKDEQINEISSKYEEILGKLRPPVTQRKIDPN